MIRWRSGIGGFTGAAKTLVKGFVTYTVNLATAIIPDPEASFGVLSKIDETGQGIEIEMDTAGQGIKVSQIQSIGVLGIISGNGQGFKTTLDTTGQGVIGRMQG